MALDPVDRFGLPDEAVQALCAAFERFPGVRRVVIFGSRAKGNQRAGSDIDLTVEGDGLAMRDLLAMEAVIDDLLLPYQVDLSLRAQIEDAALQSHIERVGRTFFERGAGRTGGECERP